MSQRHAIYYAPPADGDFWRRAGAWLGSDSSPLDLPDLPAADRLPRVAAARRYGFHATIKAPMHLAAGRSPAALAAALDSFVAAEPALPLGRPVLADLDGFIALVLAPQPAALTAFAARCVEAFEPFRAPLGAADRARRLAGGHLSPRQVELLDRYGYPYVLEQFQFHMTLTDRLPAAELPRFLAAAAAWFAPVLAAELHLDRLVIFAESAPGARFDRLTDHLLSEKVPA